MDPLLDETSLVPCAAWEPGKRISALSSVLAALDRLGAARVLRSVSGAADRDICQGRGLRAWCFDPQTNRDAGRLLATRLARQPFIDGRDGLLAAAEGARVLEVRVGGDLVYGLGLGALESRMVVALAGGDRPVGSTMAVEILDASADEIISAVVNVFAYVQELEVSTDAAHLQALVDDSLNNGRVILARFAEVFPGLRLGARASDAIGQLTGTEPVFRQLLRHLRALNAAVASWPAGSPYEPQGVTFSPESGQTLSHGKFGPLRDFPTPESFPPERWSLHTKLTGGSGARMYFRPVWTDQTKAVLIGYFGAHLPCVRFPT